MPEFLFNKGAGITPATSFKERFRNRCFPMNLKTIEDDDLLEKYNTPWDKVSVDIKNEFDSEPVYNKKFWKPK